MWAFWLPLLLGLALAQPSPLYERCAVCHKTDGRGVAGTWPPLAGHVPTLLARPGGREYLIWVVLYGLQGKIQVGSRSFDLVMPGFGRSLSDEEIAGLLNHIATQWGNRFPEGQKPFTAAEVQAQRGRNLTPAQVHQARSQLGLP